MVSTFIIVGIVLLVTLASGIWLSRLGRPYSTFILTIHKLIGLGVGVFLLVTVIQTGRAAGLSAYAIGATVAAGVSFLAAGASGGILSAAKTAPAGVTLIHKVAPALAVLSSAALLYLLFAGGTA